MKVESDSNLTCIIVKTYFSNTASLMAKKNYEKSDLRRLEVSVNAT